MSHSSISLTAIEADIRAQAPAFKEIYKIPCSQCDKPLDMMSRATPERYRLMDCTEAVSHRTLRILEFTAFPRVLYAALSYVWRGNKPTAGCRRSTHEFSVLGAEDADPIGVNVLIDVCTAALACGALYLWVVRLCIMQTDKQDKLWQIREMYRVYTFATVCVVAPGGLRVLVPLSEETQWIHRGWTLQEVVAPPAVAVLFAWTHGAGKMHMRIQGENKYGKIEVVASGQSAMMGLEAVVGICAVGQFEFTPDNNGAHSNPQSPLHVEVALFGKPLSEPNASQDSPLIHADEIHLPNVAVLTFATARNLDTEEMRDYCIWQCALVRTSSRPLDMVFSIMGLFGAVLDPADFAADDRLGATIALAREILRQGRSASWLGLAVTLPPCPCLPTFPVFPKTSVAGQAMYNLPNGESRTVRLEEAVYPNDIGLYPPLKGSMDENGYHSFNALAILVAIAPDATILSSAAPYDDMTHPTQLRALDGSTWRVVNANIVIDTLDVRDSMPPHREPRSYAVLLGFYNGIPAITTGNNLRAMLLTEHEKDLYHLRSYFLLSGEALRWTSTWKERGFCVGGPEMV
ncbi:hypothetical protein C8Q80DRAFT_1115368 [Daedaleopsis nitida]|nr:hypothetical protein C8Q80DRAFT_1115368 [Daedaleopsis nitida]